MESYEWLKYLENPLALTGLGFFLFASALKPILSNSNTLTKAATTQLINKALNYLFILALLLIIGGVWRSYLNQVSKTNGSSIQISELNKHCSLC